MAKENYQTKKSYIKKSMNESSYFTEYYIFIRYNGKWLLNNIKEHFSIIQDVVKLSESDLQKVLENERKSNSVYDNALYKD
jgi:hypothetical protein